MKLEGRVAVITGGAGGIGRTYCSRFASEGAAVAVADIHVDGAQKIVDEIQQKGGKAIAVKLDLSDPQSVAACMEETARNFGGIDILVNNAAMFTNLQRKSFYEIGVEEWDRVQDVNLRGPFLCAKAVFPYMKQKGKGKIINISSGSIFNARNHLAHYVASKMGLVGLTRVLAYEMGEAGVRVNAISPGATATDTNRHMSPREWLEEEANHTCLKKVQTPEDLAGPLVFLASDDSDFITGQMIVVDGGYTFH